MSSIVSTVAVKWDLVGDGSCLTSSGDNPWIESTACADFDWCRYECTDGLECGDIAWSPSASGCTNAGRCIVYSGGDGHEPVRVISDHVDYGYYVPLAQYEAHRTADCGESHYPCGPILSMRECALAAKELALVDTSPTLDGDGAPLDAPPYCYLEGGSLKVDPRGANSDFCSSSAV